MSSYSLDTCFATMFMPRLMHTVDSQWVKIVSDDGGDDNELSYYNLYSGHINA